MVVTVTKSLKRKKQKLGEYRKNYYRMRKNIIL